MKPDLIAFIKAVLRRAWGRSKQRYTALNSAKVSYGVYKCAECKLNHKRKNIEVDHVVPIGKFVTFDQFIERLFCDPSGLKVMCKGCHKIKTASDKSKM